MKMTYSYFFWKYVLLGMNVLISFGGVILISCGVVALGGVGSVAGAYVITSLGSFVLCLCFLGCFASIRESYVLSIVFIGSAVLGIIVQTVLMIVFAILKDSFVEMAHDRVENIWDDVGNGRAMDIIQKQYTCCGKDSPKDYQQDEDGVPKSCCLNDDCSNTDNIFTNGCSMAIVTFFNSHSSNIILTNLGLILFEVLGLASAYYLSKSLQSQNESSKKTNQLVIAE